MASSVSTRIFAKGCRSLMAAAKSASAAKADTASAAASSGTKVAKPRGRPSGLTKPLPITPALQKFIGASEISRADAAKKVWEHIKSHSLQKPDNKRVINCDDKLKSIFDGKSEVGFLEIAKLLSNHFPKSA